MANFYSVVQYVPDDIRGERINVGVIVFGAGRTLTHFLENWSRVRQFAPVNAIDELQDFQRQAKRMSEKDIRAAAENWTYGIQLTPPSGSLLADEPLLDNVAKNFLIDPPAISPRGYVVKSALATRARSRVRQALVDRFGGYGRLFVKKDFSTPGKYGPHRFDVTIANGYTIAAAEVVSFQIPDQKQLDKDASAAIWKVSDAKRENSDLGLAQRDHFNTSRCAAGASVVQDSSHGAVHECPKFSIEVLA